MTDKELIQAFHECERHGVCPSCPLDGDNCPIDEFSAANLIKRMESLLYENEHLREATKMIPKWASVEGRLPQMHTEQIHDDDGSVYSFSVSAPVLVKSRDKEIAVAQCEISDEGRAIWADDGGTAYDVTHWMPLPSTDGGMIG